MISIWVWIAILVNPKLLISNVLMYWKDSIIHISIYNYLFIGSRTKNQYYDMRINTSCVLDNGIIKSSLQDTMDCVCVSTITTLCTKWSWVTQSIVITVQRKFSNRKKICSLLLGIKKRKWDRKKAFSGRKMLRIVHKEAALRNPGALHMGDNCFAWTV